MEAPRSGGGTMTPLVDDLRAHADRLADVLADGRDLETMPSPPFEWMNRSIRGSFCCGFATPRRCW